MSVSERLAALGVEVPGVVPPVASYIPAKRHGDLVYTSGQLPMVQGALPATGKVGEGDGLVSPADAKTYARQSALNALAAAASLVGGVDNITGVLKITGFVASVPEFTGQPGVINGASEFLGEVFGEAGAHARSAVGVPVLPLDSPVEVEVVFTVA
ncbi:MAG: LysR family transcriptional regulator [Microbacterium sp. 71-36]|uniref:RidA family protein n=1 Tax=unclassified Microbacterium TaxID=2609290 RepID=UPI00086E34E0|nr:MULTISPECIES: RidA family protein [unclassified Microbacterium]MBN9212618.1 RidA family protein [Microbacterium sp.]ODT38051.1 MAG: LysR family transcriptional regulator [Microbacterium sp. SCN 71-17]ODU49693.1 MAG: LysR family transcriptional regulator [Microbacterium sp. SCN 70-10]OJV77696.1 MAG: LysR family transcriptional regulator [Microbacterium sp. 71-36]